MDERRQSVGLSDEQRLDWLRLIRSQNIGPRGIMAQTPVRMVLLELEITGRLERHGGGLVSV